MNICAVSDETYDCWKDYVKGELNVIFEYKTTKSFSFLIIFVIFVPIICRPDLPPFVDTYIYDTANRQEHGDVPRRNLGKKRSRV